MDSLLFKGTVILLGGTLYFRVMADLMAACWSDPGLSQGILIPPLAAYIAWVRRSRVLILPISPDNRGLLVAGFACVLFTLGKLGAEFFLLRISGFILLAGIIWTYWGYPRLRALALPFLLLVTMIPLPRVVYNSISMPLQLFASDVAARIVYAAGITVHREGNIIGLAAMSLGIEEACSGLNSLSSLTVAGALLGPLLCQRSRSRLYLILFAVPVAIVLNVLRIAGTAALAEYNGDFAMGFYHSFSGWLIFVAGVVTLYGVGKSLHQFLERNRIPVALDGY